MSKDVLDKFDSYEAADKVRVEVFLQERLIVGYVKDFRSREAPPLLISKPVDMGDGLPREVAEAYVLFSNAVKRRRSHRTYRMVITAPSAKIKRLGVQVDKGPLTVLATLEGNEKQLTSTCIANLRCGPTKLGELEELTPVQALLFLNNYYGWWSAEIISTYPKSEESFRLCIEATKYGFYMRTEDDRE